MMHGPDYPKVVSRIEQLMAGIVLTMTSSAASQCMTSKYFCGQIHN